MGASPYKVLNGGNLTSDVNVMKNLVDSLVANGGGDMPEAVLDALMATAQQVKWRGGDVQKVIVLIGDAPPHEDNDTVCNPNGYTFSNVINKLREQGIIVHVVSSGDLSKMKQIAEQTGGNFYEMKNDGTNLNNIIYEIASVLVRPYKIQSKFFCKNNEISATVQLFYKNGKILPHLDGEIKVRFQGCGSNGKCTNILDLLPSTTGNLTSYKNSTSITGISDDITLSTIVNVCGFPIKDVAKITCQPAQKGVTPIPEAPKLSVNINGNEVKVEWTASKYAEKYILYHYVLQPTFYLNNDIGIMYMGLERSITASFPSGTYGYVVVQAINYSGESYLSNIGEIKIP